MKLVIVGAAGRTGAYLVDQALDAGHTVTAFIRDKEQIENALRGLSVQTGDARKASDLAKALRGQDAVISVLGTNKPGDDLIQASTHALISAAHQSKLRRVIMMSSFLVSPKLRHTGFARLTSWFTKGIVKDKAMGEDLLKNSDLDWTIVYATRLDGAPPGDYHVVGEDETVSVRNAIARADVADFLIKQLDNPESIRQSIVITSK